MPHNFRPLYTSYHSTSRVEFFLSLYARGERHVSATIFGRVPMSVFTADYEVYSCAFREFYSARSSHLLRHILVLGSFAAFKAQLTL